MITIETGRVGSSQVPWEGPARDRRPVLLLFVKDIWDDQQSPVIDQTVEPISRWKVGSGCREIDISFYSLLFPSNILGTTTVPVGGATRSRCTCDTLYPISLGTERVFHASRLARNLSRLLPSILRIGTPTFTAEPSLPSPRLGSTIFFPLPISSSPLCIQTHIPACCDYPNGISTLDDYSDDKGGKGARQVEGPPAWDNGTHFARMAKEVIRSWLNVDIL